MIDNKYAKAYKEVIEIIKYLPDDEKNRIPKEKMDFYYSNMDKDHDFKIDPAIDLDKQNISKEANAIIINLFLDYFATDSQKEKVNQIIKHNEFEIEKEKRERYNPDDIFKTNTKDENKNEVNDIQNKVQENNENTSLIEYKENFLTKFINFILGLFKK